MSNTAFNELPFQCYNDGKGYNAAVVVACPRGCRPERYILKGTRARARVKQGERVLMGVLLMLVFAFGAKARVNGAELMQHDAAWVSGDVRIMGHEECQQLL